MKKALALLLFLVMGLGAVAGPDPVVALLQRPAASAGTTVVPDHFLRPWDPITIFWNSGRGPNKPGPEDDPSRFVRMEPAQPGAWRWLDARTLQFQPAEPWPPLGRVQLRGDGLEATLSTLVAPPVESEPAQGASDQPPTEAITLSFDQPLDEAALAALLTLRIAPLFGDEGDGVEQRSGRALRVKRLEGAVTESPPMVEGYGYGYGEPASAPARLLWRYRIDLDQPIPEGRSASLHLRSTVDDPGPGPAVLRFTTRAPFALHTVSCAGGGAMPVPRDGLRLGPEQALRCDGALRLQIGATAMPATPDPMLARDLVRFEPAVANLSVSAAWNGLTVTGDFAVDTLYTLTLTPAALTDTAGRPLTNRGPAVIPLRWSAREPFLELEAGQGIVERLGPKTIPLQARGHASLDLRLVRVDPLDRSLWPFPNDPVRTQDEARPPGPGEEPAPFAGEGYVEAEALRGTLSALATTGLSTLLPLPPAALTGGRFGLDLAEPLARLGGADQPGTYLVGLRALDGVAERRWMRLVVTDLSVTAVEEPERVRFVVSSLSSGQPVPGARLRLHAQAEDGSIRELLNENTDRSGAITWSPPGDKAGGHSLLRLVVQKGDDTLVLRPEDLDQAYGENGWSGATARWLDWTGAPLAGRSPPPALVCHSFVERPVYRPEDPVYLRGWARDRKAGRLSPRVGAASIELRTPNGRKSFPVELSATGGYFLKIAEKDLTSGTYSAALVFEGGARCGGVDWLMEPYRIPTFEVELSATGPAPMDRPFSVGLQAGYFAGGPVAGQPVRWRVTQLPLAWSPKARPGFLYSSDSRYGRSASPGSRARFESAATTDDKGGASLVIDPTVEADSAPRAYFVEATLTGADDQTVTVSKKIDAVPAFALGLKVPRYVEGRPTIPMEALVAGPEGGLLAGTAVTVRLVRREWHSRLAASDFGQGEARYQTDIVERAVHEATFTSGTSPTALSLPATEAGVYVVELEAFDRQRRAAVVSIDLFVAGEGAVSWEKPQAEVFTLSPDAASYEPGATAQIVVQSPFQTAEGLAVIEAPEGHRYQPFSVRQGVATLKVPIEGTFAPRLPVHVLLWRGRVAGAAPRGGVDPGKPATVAASTSLSVAPSAHQLSLRIEAPPKALPGATVPITLLLDDGRGKPLAGEVALWLVDAAVLSLGRERRLDPVPDFITAVTSRLWARDSRNLAFGRIPFAEMPGGDDGPAEDEDLFEKAPLRRDLRVVPYYEPALQIPANGRLTVQVQLPDNLTTFKLRAKAAAVGHQRFGHATGQIALRLPVVVQPALPRFVRPGDTVELGALARVVEGAAGDGRLQIEAAGLRVEGANQRSLRLDPARAVREGWMATVAPAALPAPDAPPRSLLVKLALRREADGASDAVAIPLPIADERAVVVERQIVDLRAAGPQALPPLSEPAAEASRSLVLSDDPAALRLAAALQTGLGPEACCTAARLAQARATMATTTLRSALGLSGDGRAAVESTLARLAEVIDRDGLIAEWPGQPGRVWLTAQAVEVQAEARARGWTVDGPRYERSLNALQAALRSDAGRFLDGEAYVERSAALLGLAAAGRLDRAYWSELARLADRSEAEGVAQVLLAGLGLSDAPTLSRLAELLRGGVLQRPHLGRTVYGGLAAQRAGRSPLILPSEVRAMARIARALRRVDPQDPVAALLRATLIERGGPQGWGGPDADAEVILTLAEALQGAASAPWSLTVNGVATAVPTRLLRLAIPAEGPLVLERSAGGAEAAALVETRYLPATPAAARAPRASGLVLLREGWRIEGSAPPRRMDLASGGTTHSLKVGDIVEEHLQLVLPEDRAFVAITLPLAAGLELLNPRLQGASPEATPSQRSSVTPTYADWSDDAVVFYFERLGRGTVDLYVRARATTPGRFTQPPATAALVYQPAIQASSAGATVAVAR